MTTFKHKNLPIEISYSEYIKLSESEKCEFIIYNSASVVNNTTTNVNNQTKDVLGLGEVATVAVGVPLIILGGALGLFD